MPVSDRAAATGGRNAIARCRDELTGVTLTELTDSNPTRHGLTDPRVLEVLRRHTRDTARYTPHPRGPLPAREALAARFGGAPDEYWLTSSTSQAYAWLAALLADPGERFALPTPGYPLIAPIARLAGVGTCDYRFDYVHPDGWLLDPDSLRAATGDPAVRAVVAVSPGNPTGAYLGSAAGEVITACADRGLPLICDEVFAPFALDAGGYDAALARRSPNDAAPALTPRGETGPTLGGETRTATFTLGGLSKLLCAPQLKLGWIRLSGPAADLPAIAAGLDRIADAFLPVGAPVAAALPDLLALADDAVSATRARLRTNLTTLREILGPFRVRRCDGGWTALVDVPRALPDTELVCSLMRHAHLAVHPGWFYDVAEDGVLALSLLPRECGAHMRRLRRAIEEIVEK